ncbi:unnamed protein product [Rhizopus stolonifer]
MKNVFISIQQCTQHQKDFPYFDKISDNVPEKDSQFIQKAIRELEIIQVEKKYQRNIKRTTNFQNHTLVELLLDLEKDQQIDVHVVIPRLYPDIHCTLQVQHTDLSSEKKSVIQAAFEMTSGTKCSTRLWFNSWTG